MTAPAVAAPDGTTMLVPTSMDTAPAVAPATTDPTDASLKPTLDMCTEPPVRVVETQTQLSSLHSDEFVPSLMEMLMWRASVMVFERFGM